MYFRLLCFLFGWTFALRGNGSEAVSTNELTDERTNKSLAAPIYGRKLPTGVHSFKHLGSLNYTIILPCGDANIETWEPPSNISQKLVYYHAGEDYEGVPVYVLEAGKWKLREIIDAGHMDQFDCYIIQLVHRLISSVNQATLRNPEVVTGLVILDFENLSMEQLTYVPTISYMASLAHEYHPLLLKYLDEALIINTNYVADLFLKLMKPFLGPSYAKLQIFGNNKAKWTSVLQHRISLINIPEWYGGSKEFKPVRVYG